MLVLQTYQIKIVFDRIFKKVKQRQQTIKILQESFPNTLAVESKSAFVVNWATFSAKEN